MTTHPNRSRHTVIAGAARRAFPGDTVYRMDCEHTDDDGLTYPSGTEYVPFYAGADNTRRGAPTIQKIIIAGHTATFVGQRLANVR